MTNLTTITIETKYAELIAKYPEMLEFLNIIITGRLKYPDENWLLPTGKTMSLQANCDSLFHHLSRKFAGQLLDESGYDHDLHIACRAMMSYTRKKRNIKHVDDKLQKYLYQVDAQFNDDNCLTIDEAVYRYKNNIKTNYNIEDK